MHSDEIHLYSFLTISMDLENLYIHYFFAFHSLHDYSLCLNPKYMGNGTEIIVKLLLCTIVQIVFINPAIHVSLK